MAKTGYNNARLGLFVILAVALFTYTIYRVSNKADLFKGSIQISAVFHDVRGLTAGNNVRYAGIDIGSVDNISLLGDTAVLVNMNVVEEAGTYMRKDARAEIGTNGLVGNMLVNIMPGPGQAPYVEDGDQVKSTKERWAGQMMGNLTTTTSDLILLTSNLNQITAKINDGPGTLSMLLNDEDMASSFRGFVADLERSSNQLVTVSGKVNRLMDDVNNGEGILGRLVADTTSSQRFDRILDSLERLATASPELMTSLRKSGEELSATATRLKSIVENLDQEGLTGAILKDNARVEQLEQIMTNLEEGTDKFNVSMEALQEHWLLRKAVEKMEKE